MSAAMKLPAEASTNAPARKTGTSITMPPRMPTESAIPPMMNRIGRPSTV